MGTAQPPLAATCYLPENESENGGLVSQLFRWKKIWLGLHLLIFLLHDIGASRNPSPPPRSTQLNFELCLVIQPTPLKFHVIFSASFLRTLTLVVKILLTLKNILFVPTKWQPMKDDALKNTPALSAQLIIHLVIILFTPKKLSKIMKNGLKFYLSICNHFTDGQKISKIELLRCRARFF